MRPNSALQDPTHPTQSQRVLAHIAVPVSLLPQAADGNRPSADPSLHPLGHGRQHPGTAGLASHPVSADASSHAMGLDQRPQSRNTTSSITPPNVYELLPQHLYSSLHIDQSSNSNGIHSPVGSSHSPVTDVYGHPATRVAWTPQMPDTNRGMEGMGGPQGPHTMRNEYGMAPQYQRNLSSFGSNSQESAFGGGREYQMAGSHHSGYQPIPDSNMAYMSMQQSLDPQMYASGMLPLSNSFGYQPYQYYDGRQAAYMQQTPNGWMGMPSQGYPYMTNQYSNVQSGRGGNRGLRARERGRHVGNYTPRPHHGFPQGWHGQPQWHPSPPPNGREMPVNAQMGAPLGRQPIRPNSSIASPVVMGSARHEDPLMVDTIKSSSDILPDAGNADKVLERKAYHPAPPANRSEWVMWVGNVPASATHEEMWKFFNSPLDRKALSQVSTETDAWLGVASIFLISRSNCAFVNLKNESNLRIAIAYFNGRSLRPWDSRCQPFLCRVRKADDDLKSGVGGQRGAGLHVKYIRDLRTRQEAEELAQKSQNVDTTVPSATKTLPESILAISPAAMEEPPEGPGRRRESIVKENAMISPAAFAAWQEQQQQLGQSSSAEHSYASTCSSFLVRNFQKRYFIMKSSTYDELERSFQSGVWRTQLHNEPILDQAYRTSPEVYLIFGANKQGSFSGYGIMRSGIPAVTRKPSSYSSTGRETSFSPQGARTTQLKSTSDSVTRHGGLLSPRGEAIREETGYIAEPTTRSHRLGSVESTAAGLAMLSPGEMTPGDDLRSPPSGSPLSYGWNQTAPQPERRFSASGPHPRAMTFDTKALARLRAEEALKRELAFRAETDIQDFELNKNAALDAQRDRKEHDSDNSQGVVRQDMVAEDEKNAPAATQAASDRDAAAAHASTESDSPEHERTGSSKDNDGPANDQLSHMFKVEWMQVGELPFSSIKSLRNPWNQDKEVKVSRDGTELEPAVGATLLAKWSNLHGATAPVANAISARRASQGTGRDFGRF
ncbi:hypothetical protein QFC21_005415 [Naganishia friedmannii]|uniref:Uncharacterized protein n=1 Tax=Naganishia friedmannii TaxID=89922 RepID=A0ACC2VAC4_9TREE|nr:hypothetical protein QFC21_005415 [Naganishia friedmannii]